jgi:hypothetical protein
MKRALFVLAAAALIAGSLVAPQRAQAGSGEVAAGIVGGLAVGTMLGAAAASQPRYYAPAPVYVAPPPRCYWTRGEPMWDGYRGMWVRPRVRVCD